MPAVHDKLEAYNIPEQELHTWGLERCKGVQARRSHHSTRGDA